MLQKRRKVNPSLPDLIAYDLEQSGSVTVEIFRITGQKVLQSDLGQRTMGNHVETINLNGMDNGIYMIRMTAGDSIHTSRIRVVN